MYSINVKEIREKKTNVGRVGSKLFPYLFKFYKNKWPYRGWSWSALEREERYR